MLCGLFNLPGCLWTVWTSCGGPSESLVNSVYLYCLVSVRSTAMKVWMNPKFVLLYFQILDSLSLSKIERELLFWTSLLNFFLFLRTAKRIQKSERKPETLSVYWAHNERLIWIGRKRLRCEFVIRKFRRCAIVWETSRREAGEHLAKRESTNVFIILKILF